MLRTLGAEMPRATPTKKSTPIFIKLFSKKLLRKSQTHICVELDGVKLVLGFGRNGIQKLDFDKINLSDSNTILYSITRTTNKVSVYVKFSIKFNTTAVNLTFYFSFTHIRFM